MKTLKQHPAASAVLVRGHGLFVFGSHTWQRTKMMLECYEYLFELACEMIRFGLPLTPEDGAEARDTDSVRLSLPEEDLGAGGGAGSRLRSDSNHSNVTTITVGGEAPTQSRNGHLPRHVVVAAGGKQQQKLFSVRRS
jgi:hypothetical protein